MKVWEDIVNKATLGSAKQTLHVSDLPELIVAEFDLAETQDAEENFLRLSSLAYQYRQAGMQPLNFLSVPHAGAEEETKRYNSAQAHATLKIILQEEHFS